MLLEKEITILLFQDAFPEGEQRKNDFKKKAKWKIK